MRAPVECAGVPTEASLSIGGMKTLSPACHKRRVEDLCRFTGCPATSQRRFCLPSKQAHPPQIASSLYSSQ